MVRGNDPWSDNDIENIIEEETIVRLRNLCSNEYVGTRIESEKQENEIKIFRIQGCNTNGFNLGKTGGDFEEYCLEMKNYQIDLTCVSEINLDTLNYNVNKTMIESALKSFDNKVRLQLASSSIKVTSQ